MTLIERGAAICGTPPPRKPTLAAALREAKKAGKPVKGAVIAPDGKIELLIGEPEAPEANEWEAEIIRMSKQ
jgi:hypothetical protein